MVFFGAKIRFFPTGCRKPPKPMRGKNVSFGRDSQDSDRFWPSIGHPLAIMKNLNGQLSHIHISTDIRVSVDDEHLAVHLHANLFMLLMILNVFGG